MASKNVYLNWDSQSRFTVHDRDGHQLPINGEGRISASDMLSMSLIGCSSHDVVEILGKQRQELTQLKVTAESVQDDDPPWKFRKIHIHYQAIGKGLNPEKVKNAILLSREKYCSVYVTLKDVIEITYDVEVTEG
ncbi:OsmC family protein [Chloroflexota bacterium]